MKRRCWFLDNLPAYNYNTGIGIKRKSGEITDTHHLGSTLIAAMIKEAEQFCQPCLNEDGRDYHQVLTAYIAERVIKELCFVILLTIKVSKHLDGKS